ncbi:MAG: fibrobacter succinogenes major paralogous domain-containing protein [Alistipes sp.]|nr:fibrobacter succinogenes major paralogous domain-containing protein [Alistipes sp.]
MKRKYFCSTFSVPALFSRVYIPAWREACDFFLSFNPAIVCNGTASGNRNRETGALTNVGAYGECWSSSPAAAGSGNACYLEFNSDRSYPMNSNYRANGFSVRCVQHLRELFFILMESDEAKTASPIRNGAGYGSCQCDRVDSAIPGLRSRF